MGGPNERYLLKELMEMNFSPPLHCSAGPVDDGNLLKWNAMIFGPIGTPYEDGCFQLKLEFSPDYPFKPPTIRFLTKIYHPNVDSSGFIGLEVLGPGWRPIGIHTLLIVISSLFSEPDLENPMDCDIAEIYVKDSKTYCKVAREWTNNFALLK